MDKIPVWWYIIGIPASAGLDVNVRRLCNWIFLRGSSRTQCVLILFKAKVNVEYQFGRFQNTVAERWNTYNIMYCVKWKMTIVGVLIN